MGPRADQEYFVGCNCIDQEPIRFDVTLPNAAPLAGQFVRTIGGREGALFGKQFDHRNEIVDIFAATLLTPEIVAKSLPLRNSAHGIHSKRTHLFGPRPDGLETLNVLAAARLPERLACSRVRDSHGK